MFEQTTFSAETYPFLVNQKLVCLSKDLYLEVVIGMMQTLKSRIGSSIDIGERFTAPTLWGSTACITDDLTKVSEDVVAFKEILKPIADIVKQVDMLVAKVNMLEKK
jgi:hypothetical protein